MYGGSHRIEQEDFSPKRKRPSRALWGIPLQQHHQSPLHPATSRVTVRTASQKELRLQAPPQAGCPATRSVPSNRGVCPPTRDCAHLISEGAETTGTTWGRVPRDWEYAQRPESVCTSSQRELRPQAPGRVRTKEGSACTPIARRPTIKKRVGRSWEHQDSSWKRKPTNEGNANR